MITIILRTKNRIKYKINALMFIYGIGTLGKQYDELGVIDRMAFAAEKFGRTFPQVIQERVWYNKQKLEHRSYKMEKLKGYRTVVFGVLVLLVALANLLGFDTFVLPPEWEKIYDLVIPLAVLILRFITTSPVGEK